MVQNTQTYIKTQGPNGSVYAHIHMYSCSILNLMGQIILNRLTGIKKFVVQMILIEKENNR